jgi:defect-in-organelle-trafficking protein DotB
MKLNREDFLSAVNIEPRLQNRNDLDILLKQMIKIKASDLFLLGDDYAWAHVSSKKVRLTKRILTNKEVQDMLQSFYGVNATAKLGMPEPIDVDLELKETLVNESKEKGFIRHRFRVNAINSKRNGRLCTNVTIRSISSQPPRAEDLDIEDKIIDICTKSQQGLILVVGATGNGKSTTLASLLRHMLEQKNANRNIVTIESPIEYVYDDIEKPDSIISQLQIGQCVESFSEGVRNSLRMAPTDILIGEARDFETISTAIAASTTGHLVLSTVHANNTAETIQRMVSAFPESLQKQGQQNLMQALKMIVAQRLVPKIGGGRIALREYMIFDQDSKNVLSLSKNITVDCLTQLNEKGVTMIDDAKIKFKQGLISEETLDKVRFNYDSGE